MVGLNNDESIARLKGPERPINSLTERAMVLSALASVDWVIPFGAVEENDTPAKLIEMVSPDILVKGGDYKVSEIAGAEHVLNLGGKVEVLPFLDGCSTSNVIAKARLQKIDTTNALPGRSVLGPAIAYHQNERLATCQSLY